MILILGAIPSEKHIKELKDVMTLDINPYDDLSHICADFNNLEQLQTVLEEYKGKFKRIIPDLSVIKFSKWSIEHLKIFYELLQEDGQFIYYTSTCGYRCYDIELQEHNKEELEKTCIKVYDDSQLFYYYKPSDNIIKNEHVEVARQNLELTMNEMNLSDQEKIN